MPDGCREQLDKAFLDFLKYVWTYDAQYRPTIEQARLAIAPQMPVVRLRNAAEIARFLATPGL